MSALPLPAQAIDATQALNRSAGVSKPKVLRGRSLSCPHAETKKKATNGKCSRRLRMRPQSPRKSGAHMKRGKTAVMLLAFAIGLATVSAQAQGMGGMGGGHKHQKQTDKTDPQKPRTDDKAYKAALKNLPDKPKLDPWQGAR